MRFIEDLCPPALLYLLFLVIQLGMDASLGMWITMIIKAILGLATVVVLDTLCSIELGVVSWFLVATPFIVTALGTAIAIGTNFDAMILNREKFVDESARESDIPENSSSPVRVSKDYKKSVKMD